MEFDKATGVTDRILLNSVTVSAAGWEGDVGLLCTGPAAVTRLLTDLHRFARDFTQREPLRWEGE